MARVRFGVETVFLILGVGLLAGAVYSYDVIVVRPRSWPQTDAFIVSSRVVNPRGPSSYSPELVFRLDAGGSTRDVTVSPSWSSSSYDMVHGHVERFPAGRHVNVAVNPGNPADVRYDLTPSMENLILPGVLGMIGLVFAVVGVFTARAAGTRPLTESTIVSGYSGPAVFDARGMPIDAGRAAAGRLVRRVSLVFLLIGAILVTIGAMVARSDLATLREWPQVEGQVLESSIVTRSSSGSRSGSGPIYDTAVKFRYSVNGVTYENSTTYGVGSSSRSSAEARAAAYSPATRHRIWHRPDDPNLIRFDLESPFTVFALSAGLMLMGAVFLTFGGVMRRRSGSSSMAASYATDGPDTDDGDSDRD